MSSFFGELYLRSTLPFLSNAESDHEASYLAKIFQPVREGWILDVGCGHGRHASRLAARGFRVLGADFDALSLSEREAGFLPVQADFRALPFRRLLMGAFAWYSTLFAGSDEDNAESLAQVAGCLSPGACCVLHTVPREWFVRHPRAAYEGRLPDGTLLREENAFDERANRDVGTRWLKLPDGRVLTGSYAIRAYALPELEALARRCGFAWAWAHGDVFGSPFAASSSEIIVGLTRVA